MRPIKTNVLTGIFNDFFVDSPMPTNISYMWNFGSLLGATLALQIATGVTLAMHYCPNTDLAFSSVEHIMRDVNSGYIIRYAHANGASMFFILVYLHIARGLYYGSYAKPRVLLWSVGVIILLLLIIIAFLGLNGQKWVYFYNVDSSIQCFTITALLTPSTRLKNFLDKLNIKPVIIFEDLTNPSVKKTAYRHLKRLSGVYMIINLVTGKYYIGSAVTGNFYMRFHKHLFSLSGNKRVANAVTKYGLQEFAFIVLEIIPEKEKTQLEAQAVNSLLISREDYYLDVFKPEYNIIAFASNSAGWKHSEDSLVKMRNNYSLERRQRVGNINKGKTLSEETRKLMSEAAQLRVPMSKESRKKCAVNMRPVTISNLDNSNPIHFVSIKEASVAISCAEKTIRRALNGNGVLKKTYIVSAQSAQSAQSNRKDIIE